MRVLSRELNKDINNVETILGDLQVKLNPVTMMNDTVGLSKSNIAQASSRLKQTYELTQKAEEMGKMLKRKELITAEYEMYAHQMDEAKMFLDQDKLKGYLNQKQVYESIQKALVEASDLCIQFVI